MVVVEPKGDLVEALLERLPEDRLDDVVVIDPTDVAPVGLNPLAGRSGDQELAVDGLLAVFKGLFADAWGPRTEDILTAGLLTLSRQPNASLVHLPLLLTDARFRGRALERVHDPLALDGFWAWYEDLSAAERAAVIAPVLNKVRRFLLRPAVRAVIGQTAPRFDIESLFTERRIVLVDLAKGRLGGESAGLLGALFVARLWQATLARQRIAPERRHVVVAVLDEFQDYLRLPTDLAEVLAQSRGLGLAWHLAHQHLGQLSPTLRTSVLANARSRVVFQLGDEDARTIARLDDRLDPADLRGLGPYQMYASLAVDGNATGFASGRTAPAPSGLRRADEVRAKSRARWGVPRAETEAALRHLADPETRSAKAVQPETNFGVRRVTDPDEGERS